MGKGISLLCETLSWMYARGGGFAKPEKHSFRVQQSGN